MGRYSQSFLFYALISIGAIVVFFASDLGGVYSSIASLIGIYLSKNIVFLFFSFINFSLSIAFDNFIRVDPYFYFYDGGGVSASYLCLISTLFYCFVGFVDYACGKRAGKGRLVDFAFPEISPALFYPLIFLILGVAIFIVSKESFVLSAGYDAYELQKYPFLEYFGLAIAFMISAARTRQQFFAAYFVGFLFSIVCLATSYRMVAIVCVLSLFAMRFNGRRISKKTVVLCWLAAYVGLTYISYWRVGHFDVDLENIFGYYNGRMDNTFSGVIETALIYTKIGAQQDFSVNIGYMVGALLPLPNSFIPDSMLYIVDAMNQYYFPGGGALAGFIVYFNYIYVVPFSLYIFIAFYGARNRPICGAMYFILFIVVARWSLYGPYVIFKFFGVLMFLLIASKLADAVLVRSVKS
ncbi:hypothetical protein DOK_02016 [gamma proteobacterium BDW918]|nr:hypothetical protein DOK_02016 [gamma proteobacterium BDW918]